MRRLWQRLLRWCDENEDKHTGHLGERRVAERRKWERRQA